MSQIVRSDATMITRRHVLCGAALAAASAHPLLSRAKKPIRDIDAEVRAAARAAIDGGACPAVQVAISRRGSPILSEGYGFANLETRAPASPANIFRIGSLTKQFIAAAIIKLAAQGQVSLDAPTSKYLPAFAVLQDFSLLELIHHTAGLRSDESETSSPGGPGPKRQIQLAEEIARQKKPFDFEPGTAWLYSNANYIVLGAVIETVMQTSLANAMSTLVFDPLMLESTAIDRASDVLPGRVSGYTPTGNATASFENAAFIQIYDAGGAGAIRSTALDLCRWHDTLLSAKLFDRAHLALMLMPGRLRDGRLSGANRFSTEDAHYGDVQYAGGLLVSAPNEPNRSILHYGFINGFASVLQTFTDQRLSFAVLCNGDTGPALPFRAIRQAVASHYLTK